MNPFSASRLGRRRTQKSITLVALLGCALIPRWSGADEQVRQVQEELRRRNLYFGEVDGRNTEEIHEAMRRYQQRKGFPATGAFEQETLRSLGIQMEPPAAGTTEPLPDVPVLKSDSAREVSEKDRKFLEDLTARSRRQALAKDRLLISSQKPRLLPPLRDMWRPFLPSVKNRAPLPRRTPPAP